MLSIFLFITVVFVPFTPPAASNGDICGKSTPGLNVTSCQAACLEQQCKKWSCNGSVLKTCEQDCFDPSKCNHLSCDGEMIEKCEQYCAACRTMKCNSRECDQRCTTGFCHDITCNATKYCQQFCSYCRRQRCYGSANCAQTCFKSDCSLECQHSEVCNQNCFGDGCSASCLGNGDCVQNCGPRGNCTRLICDSKVCKQNCQNNSKCELLRCSGSHCTQETSVENSKLECSSSICFEQVSRVSNTVLSCGNTNGVCKQYCSGTGCDMTCDQNVKTCEQYCAGGNCNMSCTHGVESCSMECAGGNCRISCEAKQCLFPCNNTKCEKENEQGKKTDKDKKDDREKCDSSAQKTGTPSFLYSLFVLFYFAY